MTGEVREESKQIEICNFIFLLLSPTLYLSTWYVHGDGKRVESDGSVKVKVKAKIFSLFRFLFFLSLPLLHRTRIHFIISMVKERGRRK